jgi:hypothetical protein
MRDPSGDLERLSLIIAKACALRDSPGRAPFSAAIILFARAPRSQPRARSRPRSHDFAQSA